MTDNSYVLCVNCGEIYDEPFDVCERCGWGSDEQLLDDDGEDDAECEGEQGDHREGHAVGGGDGESGGE